MLEVRLWSILTKKILNVSVMEVFCAIKCPFNVHESGKGSDFAFSVTVFLSQPKFFFSEFFRKKFSQYGILNSLILDEATFRALLSSLCFVDFK